jgi:tRNA A-37 threonylcarbamoyl transferase component Bud32
LAKDRADGELLETLQAQLSLAGVDDRTVERNPGSTIVPSTPGLSTPDPQAILALLGSGATIRADRVALEGTLGEGGMGVVRLGRQHALDRLVAVKSLKPDFRDPRSIERLLREAWVTGHLDHPNVVPVYDIVRDGDGSPLIVLKKIEGVEWGKLMHDRDEVAKRFGTDDLLEWNLGVALQVCNAVSYAHSKHVLHRDLKPENVMIGAFGEVYVCDWGLAVLLEDDGNRRLPLAADARAMAGTPHYMAPEMLGGAESLLSERTDVYLLGAVLYEILTGNPPHRGETFLQIVASVVRSEPEIGPDVPSELAAIAKKALEREPADRYESVEQLRVAIRNALRHRDADRVAARGNAALASLLELVETAKKSGDDHTDAVFRKFVECRAGFGGALDIWAEHPTSIEGLARTIETMVDFLLSRNEPETAHTLLSELSRPPPELVARVGKARADKATTSAELKRLQDDHDWSAGRRTRFFVGTVITAVWTVVPIVVNALVDAGVLELYRDWRAILIPGALFVFVGGFAIWARESMTRTKINRGIGATALTAMAANVIGAAVSSTIGKDPWEHIHEQHLLFAAVGALAAVTIERWFALSAIGYLVGYLLIPVVGETKGLYVLGACNSTMLLVAVLRWGRRDDVQAAAVSLKRRTSELVRSQERRRAS